MKSGGFTLIELLVVIAIIGIIAAVALPAFSTYRERAWDSKTKMVAHTLYQGQEGYFTENDTYYDCSIVNGVSSCGALPGINSLVFNGANALAINLPDGVLVVACHAKAPHAFAIVTDPTHEHYYNGQLDEVNIGGSGQCEAFIASLGP